MLKTYRNGLAVSRCSSRSAGSEMPALAAPANRVLPESSTADGRLGRRRGLELLRVLGELRLLRQPGHRLLQRLQVGQDELGDDRLDVALRPVRALDPGHVGVAEDPDDLADRVGLADVAEELVAHPLPLRGPLDQPGDVGEAHRGRHHPRRVVELRQRGEPRIGDADDADVRLDGGERVVRGQRPRLGQRVEQGGLADVGQTDDSDRQAHEPRV